MLLLVLVGCETTGEPQPSVAPTITAEPLSPAQLLDRAVQQQNVGQYDQAAGEYQQVIAQYPSSPEARIAKFGLAHSAFLRQDWAAARSLLESFVNAGGDDLWYQRALFLLARVAETQGDHAGAVEAYRRYINTAGPLTGYAAIRQAAQLKELGQLDAAVQAFEAGGAAPIAATQRVSAYQSAIDQHLANNQTAAALADIEAMLTFIRSPEFRPSVLADAAAKARSLGFDERAIPWLREIVEQWPHAPEAPQALADLLSMGQSVDFYRQGEITFIHGQWADAVSAFDQALAGELSPEQRGEARRKRALAIREQGDFITAEALLTQLADEQPDTDLGRQARLDAIQTYGQAGDRQGALDLYRAFASTYPDDPLAPEALRRVVEITSWSGDPAAIIAAQRELGLRYPWSNPGQSALHEAAWYAFQQGQFEQALSDWRTLGDTNRGLPQAQGYYWAGRTAINLGDQAEGRRLLEAAYHAAPNSYYAARVADLLGIEETASLPLGAGIDPEAEAEGQVWIAAWASTTITDSQQLAVDPFSERALELSFVDMPTEALAEWNAARDAAGDNPYALYTVALAAARANAPYAAVQTARRLVELAPADAPEPPIAVRQMLYPTPYPTAVINQSANFELDPRVLYALMRQESIFNPDATSWVGARGLAQVMPTTGEGIAQNLGVQDFHPDDLYQPVISIRFGAFYIAAQIERMNGSIQGGLAAYNGGPGNAERWANGTVVQDPDQFLATIDYPETQHYVEVVYANYGAYRRLYRR